MREIVRLAMVGVVASALAMAACAGGNKPPMVPDAPDPAVGDAGPDLPQSAPVPTKK